MPMFPIVGSVMLSKLLQKTLFLPRLLFSEKSTLKMSNNLTYCLVPF